MGFVTFKFFFRHDYIPYSCALPLMREHWIIVLNPKAYLPRASITALATLLGASAYSRNSIE
ncbi:hypothetical protein CBW58_05175 [Yersinia frederiksenii]|nr:hypothetical protein CRN75_01260 [Yersinia frederiksenii]OVZ93807.1 hypothetical protein CBW58_05175 [Yersinia frederiksenii]OWF69424.1 hypothetical protein B4901_07480 [Yersinia frederiksenii]OWF78086.1 hypothetical protein B4903_13535 [Yersinia frederiksenii]